MASFDPNKCFHCGRSLHNLPKGQEKYNGACGPACWLHHMLTVSGAKGAISGQEAIIGRSAIEELQRPNGRHKKKGG